MKLLHYVIIIKNFTHLSDKRNGDKTDSLK